jgi:diguanylate cyclase (GGDEF)-like protein
MTRLQLFSAQGKALGESTLGSYSPAMLKMGWRVLLPLADLATGPLYLKIESHNPAFAERVIRRAQLRGPEALMTQQRTLMASLLSATLLLSSALFNAAFAFALRDREFGKYAGYSMALGTSLFVYARFDLQLLGADYGWLWQLATPLSTCLLCWLSVSFGRFERSSTWLVRALYAIIAVDALLFAWSALALIGVPLPLMPFDRFNYENYQDIVMESLILLGGWLGWRRGEDDRQDCLLLMLSLVPPIFIDLVNRLWDPILTPFLQARNDFVLPHAIDAAIHFNGAVTWMLLPAVFCFALGRRAFRLHIALINERNMLEVRVEHRTLELRSTNKELESQANTDALTGLLNRRRIMAVIEQEILRARRYGHGLTLCMIDIDHFKAVNDSHGHVAGDRALVAIAGVLSTTLRTTDAIARFGGEEFVLLLTETQPEMARELVERLRVAIAATPLHSDDGKQFSVTISAGIAGHIQGVEDDSINTLLARADQALYKAKSSGRNRVELA